MKQLAFQILLISVIFVTGNAQNALLVYTNFPGQLNFIDASNNRIPKKALWNKDDGGYIINTEELDKTFVVSTDDNANFKLSNNSKLTKLIAIQANSKVSVDNFFRSEKYCCVKLNDKQKKGSEKLFAVNVMKKSGDISPDIVFDNSNQSEIISLNTTYIWKSTAPIKHIYLLDVNSLEIIWESENYEKDSLVLTEILTSEKSLTLNHKYQINIITGETTETEKKHVYEFDYKNFAFTTSDYHFATPEALQITWESKSQPLNIIIKDTNGNELWSAENYTDNKINISTIGKNIDKLEAETEYSAIFTLNNGESYTYNFVILMSLYESAELKALVE